MIEKLKIRKVNGFNSVSSTTEEVICERDVAQIPNYRVLTDNFLKNAPAGEIKKGDKVYFIRDSTYSRRRFREDFPECSIVRDFKKADVIILPDNPCGYFHSWNMKELNDGSFVNDSWRSLSFPAGLKFKDMSSHRIYFINDIYFISLLNPSPRIVRESWLMNNIKGGMDIDDEYILNLIPLLKSKDINDIKLGARMLGKMNVEKHAGKLAYVLSAAKKNLEIMYNPGRAEKTILKAIENKYQWSKNEPLDVLKKIVGENEDNINFFKKVFEQIIQENISTFEVEINLKKK